MGLLDALNKIEQESDNQEAEIINEIDNPNNPTIDGVDPTDPPGSKENQEEVDLNREAYQRYQNQINPESQRPNTPEVGSFISSEKIDAGMAEQFAESFTRGMGTAIGSLGDIAQAVPGLIGDLFGSDKMWEENTLSSFFHGIGETLEIDHQNYVPEEFQEVSMKSLTSVEGWKYLISNQLAEAVPYALEFMATGIGAGSVAKKLASRLAKKRLLKIAAKNGNNIGKAVTNNAIKGVSKSGASKGAEYGGRYIKGNDTFVLDRLLVTEEGLSSLGKGLAGTIGAGAVNNQLISLSQATESYNQAKMIKDENGQPLFDVDDLSQIARDTYLDEMKYIGMDMLSWGITFGKVPKGLSKMVGFEKGAQKGLSKTFGSKVKKIGLKFGLEGGEETFQETYEEWAKLRNIERARIRKGDLDESEAKYDSYFDFYTSKETEGLKIVAGLMGGLMAGGKASIDLMAEKQALMSDKQGMLETYFDQENVGADVATKQRQIRTSLISEMVFQGRAEMVQEAFKDQVKSGEMTKEQYDEFVKETNDHIDIYNQSQNLNVKGVEALFFLLSDKKHDQKTFEIKKKELQEEVDNLKKLDISNASEIAKIKQKEINGIIEEEQKKLEKSIEDKDARIQNLILGKRAVILTDKDGKNILDDKGNLQAEGLVEKDYERFTIDGEKELGEKVKDKGNSIINGVKNAIKNVKNPFKKKDKNDDSDTDVDTDVDTDTDTDVNTDTDTDESGQVDSFGDKLTKLDDIDLEDTKAVDDFINSKLDSFSEEELKNNPKIKEKFKNFSEGYKKIVKAIRISRDAINSVASGKLKASEAAVELQKSQEIVDEVRKDKNLSVFEKNFLTKKIEDQQAQQKADLNGGRSKKDLNGGKSKKSIKSDKANKIIEEAESKKVPLKQHFTEKVDALLAKGIKSVLSKEKREEILKEIDTLLEFEEFKKTSSYKTLKELKKAKADFSKLKKKAKQTAKETAIKFSSKKSSIKRLENSTEREVHTSNRKLYTIEELHNLYGNNVDSKINAKLYLIRKNLAKNHKNINLVMVDDIEKVIGVDSLAYAIGSTIFITPNGVVDPQDITHEMAHILYKITEDEPQTIKLVNHLLKDTKMVNRLRERYYDELEYEVTENGVSEIKTFNQIAEKYGKDVEFETLQNVIDLSVENELSIKPLADSEQEVIKDELYAYYMQAKLMDNHTPLLLQKANKSRFTFYEKGFWKNVKSKVTFGIAKSTSTQDTIDLLNDLDIDGIPKSKDNLGQFISDKFKKGIDGKDVRKKIRGRRKVDLEIKNKVEKQLKAGFKNKYKEEIATKDAINSLFDTIKAGNRKAKANEIFNAQQELERIENEKEIFRNKGWEYNEEGNSFNSEIIENINNEYDGEFSEAGEYDQTSGNLEEKSTFHDLSHSKFINRFVNKINSYNYENKNKKRVSKESLDNQLLQLARSNENNIDFISAVENASNPEFKTFVKFLKEEYGNGYEQRLVGIFTMIANDEVYSQVMHNTRNGSYSLEEGYSNNTNFQTTQVIDSLFKKQKLRFKKQKEGSTEKAYQDEYKSFEKSLKKIKKSGKIDKDGVDFNNIMNILFQGKSITAEDDTIFIDSNEKLVKEALLELINKSVQIQNKVVTKNNVTNSFENVFFKIADFRPLVKSIIQAENNKKGSGMMGVNAEGNSVSLRHKATQFSNESRRINKDLASKTYNEISSKYKDNYLVKRLSQIPGGKIVAKILGGTDSENNSSVFKNSNSEALLFSNLGAFMQGGKDYMQPMFIGGNSARGFLIKVPKVITSRFRQGEINILYKQAVDNAVRNGDVRFKGSDGKGDISLLTKALKDDYNEIVKRSNENPEVLKKLEKDLNTKITGEDGKLSTDGKRIISDFVVNSTTSQIFIRDLFAKNVNEEQLGKRGKTAYASQSTINSSGKLRMSLLVVKDLELNPKTLERLGINGKGGMNTSDSMNFMLPQDIDRVKGMYNTAAIVGDNLKLVSFSNEVKNKNAQGAVTIKGLTFPLTKQFIKENPGYKALRDTLQEMRDDIVENHNGGNELDFNLNNGSENYLPMAVASSSLKTGGLDKKGLSVEELGTEEGIKKAIALNTFDGGYGFNGSDIGVQNIMDKQHTSSVVSSQLLSSININASNKGNLNKVEEIHDVVNQISELSLQQELDKVIPKDKNLNEKDFDKIKEYLKEAVNEELLDPVTFEMISNKDMSVAIPYVNGMVTKIIKNRIVKSSLRMYTDGTVGLQMADFGMYKSENGRQYSSDLKGYGFGSDSTKWIDTEGNEQSATTPAETLIPKGFADKAGTRLRESGLSEKGARIKALDIAREDANQMGLKGKEFNNYVNKFSALLVGEDSDGFFVRGELYIGTRIPNHGLQLAGVLEAKATTGEGMGSAVIIPTSLSEVMGSDFDGDALFMNLDNGNRRNKIKEKSEREIYRLKKKAKNKMMDLITGFEYQDDLQLSLEMEGLKQEIENKLQESLNINISLSDKKLENNKEKSKHYALGPIGQMETFKDNHGARGLVGVAASLHRFMNILASYNVPFTVPFEIDGKIISKFEDFGKNNQRSHATALLLNIILDNDKNKMAEKIGINPSTASQFIILVGMGYDIPTVSAIMNSRGAKAWEKASNNKTNPFYEGFGKNEVVKNAKQIAKVGGKVRLVSINTSNINAINDSKNTLAVITLLDNISNLNGEMMKVNKVLSTHKTLENNPFTLQKDLNSFNEEMKGENLIQYNDDFKKSGLVKKYVNVLEKTIEVNKKTNPVYTPSTIKIAENYFKLSGLDYKKNYDKLQMKLTRYVYGKVFNKMFSKENAESVLERIYGNENGDLDVFSRLELELMNNPEKYEDLSTYGVKLINNAREKSISIDSDLKSNGNVKTIRDIRSDFESLPSDLKKDLILYDFLENSLLGSRSIAPLFDTKNQKQLSANFEAEAKKIKRAENNSSLRQVQEEVFRSMHSSLTNVPFDSKTSKFKVGKETSLYNKILKNETFIFKSDKIVNGVNQRQVYQFVPYNKNSQEWSRILIDKNERNQLSEESKNTIIKRFENLENHNLIGDEINIDTLYDKTNPLYKDLNILTARSNNDKNGSPLKKKGRSKKNLDNAESITRKLTQKEWQERNELKGIGRSVDDKYKEYENQYEQAYQYFDSTLWYDKSKGEENSPVSKMSDEKLLKELRKFDNYQPEAASIVTNELNVEIAKRNASKHSKFTKVIEGVKDLPLIKKWFGSTAIPSKLPGLQAIAKKINERHKEFLRRRTKDYSAIDKVTKALYKDKFSRLQRANPFKGKDQYETLYGNLIVEEIVGDKGIKNFRLKDEAEINKLYKNGSISEAEKDFYDVFRGITKKYEGLTDKKRKGYIPHTSQSAIESYSNRGMLGMFMNSQSFEQGVNDVVLTGYDPVLGETVTQPFKKFKDSYEAVSSNKSLGNSNKFKNGYSLIRLQMKAKSLYKKGTNEDGSDIKMSSFTVQTLGDFSSRNRFTNSRSDKSTLFPSKDLNKAIMDFTHASSFATSFNDMFTEVQSMVVYYKNKDMPNAAELVEKMYRDKILLGEKQTSMLGKKGDKVLKGLNTVAVFTLLGFQGLYAIGNVLAGKYHNVKNQGGKSWVTGEKRFWGVNGGNKGLKGAWENFQQSMRFLNEVGFLEQNVYEEINLEKKYNPINALENWALLPMTLSERWIQGVQFLGQLSEEEWTDYKENGKLPSVENQLKYEEEVKKSQGRGYNLTDQRMISLYSLGQSFMMFSRYIPTMINDRFGKDEIDIYGRESIGSLRQFKNTAQDVITGRMKYKDFVEYRKTLPTYQQEALTKAVRGMALLAVVGLIGAAADDGDDLKYYTNGIIYDANVSLNLPKLVRKSQNIPVLNLIQDNIN